MIPDEFFQEIEGYAPVYISVSGGQDSTYTALQFYNRGIQSTLVHNNTLNRMKSSITTLQKIQELTGYTFVELKPEVKFKEVTIDSFLALKKAKEMKDQQRYSKKVFRCCYHLKHKPFAKFLKSTPAGSIVISSIRPGESMRRSLFLRKLRNLNTFLNYHKRHKVMYGYPLRDFEGRSENSTIIDYFRKIGWNVKHSGCNICPVLLLFNLFKKDPLRYVKSKRFYLSLTNKPCIKLNPQTVLTS